MSSGSSHYALENKDFFINIWNSEKKIETKLSSNIIWLESI